MEYDLDKLKELKERMEDNRITAKASFNYYLRTMKHYADSSAEQEENLNFYKKMRSLIEEDNKKIALVKDGHKNELIKIEKNISESISMLDQCKNNVSYVSERICFYKKEINLLDVAIDLIDEQIKRISEKM